MQRVDARFHHAIGHGDFNAVVANFFHLRRPLIDDGDVQAGFGEIGADAAADGAATEYCDFLAHIILPILCIVCESRDCASFTAALRIATGFLTVRCDKRNLAWLLSLPDASPAAANRRAVADGVCAA